MTVEQLQARIVALAEEYHQMGYHNDADQIMRLLDDANP